MGAWILALGLTSAASSRAASHLVENMHKAQTRQEPAERLEYYDRAVKAWEPSDGAPLLAQARFGRGEALVDNWKFVQAEPDLTQALETDPANAKAYFLRGQARFRQEKYGEAVSDLLEFVGRDPADLPGLLLLSQAQLKAGRGDAAQNACRLAQQAETEDPRGWLCEGRVWLSRKNWAAAETAMGTADDKAAHRLAEALAGRAVSRVAQGRHEAALKDYSAAIPLHEAKLQDMSRRAVIEPERAEERLTCARTYYGRGRVLEFLARHKEALADYQRACQLGHEPSCERAEALAPGPAPTPVKKRKFPEPTGDPGSRIYGG